MTQTPRSDTAALETIREALGDLRAGRVFGEPIHQDGVTILPVAKVSGGGGGGGGGGTPAETGQEEAGGSGAGGGMGMSARPLGVFVIKDGDAAWRPAIDINKVILGGQLVAVAALLLARAVFRARAREV